MKIPAIHIAKSIIGQSGSTYTGDGRFGRVGNSNQFGVSETDPRGLAAIGNTLYMVGAGHDALYTVNKNTGVATRVGSATAFGVREGEPTGLASIGNTLYMVGTDRGALYTVNKNTGVATRVGSSRQFSVSEGEPTGLASIGNTLYMVGAGNDVLYIVDRTTGVATRVGNVRHFGLGSEIFPYGLASIGNILYMIDAFLDRLYTVNITTGAATAVSEHQINILGGTHPRGLASIDGMLYLTERNTDALYQSPAISLDPPTMLEVSPQGQGGLRATWAPPESGNTPSSYQIRWKKASVSSYAGISPVTASGTSHLISALLANTAYDVQVRSVSNSQQSAWTTPVRGTTLAVVVPITPSFGVPVVDNTARTARVPVSFSSVVTGLTTADFTLNDVTAGSASRVSIVSVVQDPGNPSSGDDYLVNLSLPLDRNETVELSIAPGAMATEGGNTKSIATRTVNVVYNTRFVSSQYGVFSRVGNATAFGRVRERSPTGLAAIGNTLYMVGWDNDELFIVDTTTGVATRVGSATNFGVGENFPTGLAAIGNTLYMVGVETEALYTVNPTTGVATRIGSATEFGVREGSPLGLAAIGNTLYMVGQTNDVLYTVDTTTGVATRVGSATEFGVGETLPYGLAAIGNTLYMVGQTNDVLYTLDTTTGIATRLGTATAFGVGEDSPTGLASIGNVLYMVGQTNDVLYRSPGTITPSFGTPAINEDARTAQVGVTFASVVTGLTTADFTLNDVTSGAASRVSIVSVVQDPGNPSSGDDYLVNLSLPANRDETVQLSIASDAQVSVGGEIRDVVIRGVNVSYDTRALQVPTMLEVEPTGQGGLRAALRAAWSAPGSGVTPSSYQVRWKMSSESSYGSPVAVTATQYNITDLEDDTAYDVQVRSVRGSQQSAWTTAVRATTQGFLLATLTLERFSNENRQGTILITFPRNIYSRTVGAADFVITGVEGIVLSNFSSGSIAILDDTIEFDFSLPEQSSGTFTIRMQGMVDRGREGPTQRWTSNELTINFNTFTPVDALISPPSPLPLTALTGSSVVRFNSVVTDFALADLTKSGDPDDNVTLDSITAYTGADARSGQDYFVNYSIAVDTTGSFQLGFATDAAVTVNGNSVGVNVGSVAPVTYNTVRPIAASFSQATGTGNTRTVRVTWVRPIAVASFTTGDVAVTAPAGVVISNIRQVNTGATDTEFDLIFSLPARVLDVVGYDITGQVTEGSVNRFVTATPGTFSFNTVPDEIQAGFSNLPPSNVGGNFSVQVNFSANTGVVISGFTAGDVSLSGDTDGLTDYTVTSIAGQPHDFHINFTPAVDTSGTVQIGVSGTVVVDGVIHAVIITPTSVSYDIRNAISAVWADTDGIKTGIFTIRLLFSGSEPIELPDSSHFTITRIEGATISDLGISDFTIAAIPSSNDFALRFTPAESQEGIFEIDVGGRVNAGTSGSQVMREVSIPSVRISVNTTNTVPEPRFNPAVIPAPIWENIPLGITVADTDHDIDLNFGENIRGLTLADIVEEGIDNNQRLLSLYRVVGGVEVLHNDNTPAALFTLKVRINANQSGNLSFLLRPNSVVSVDDATMGPISGVLSPSIPYDTFPEQETPITIESWNVSRGNRLGMAFVFTANFSAPVSNTPAELRASLDVEGVDIDVTDTSLVEIAKSADNMSATITVNAPEDFTGSISVGLEENDLRGV